MYSAKSARGDRTRADKKALAYVRARAIAQIRAVKGFPAKIQSASAFSVRSPPTTEPTNREIFSMLITSFHLMMY